MSQENVKVIERAYEALNAGQRVYSFFHPALIYHPRADEPDPSAHVGRDAYERLLDGFLDSFRDLRFDVLGQKTALGGQPSSHLDSTRIVPSFRTER